MTWKDFSANFASNLMNLTRRFPNADKQVVSERMSNRAMLTSYLAESSQLTPFEVQEELDDWLFVQGLARDAADLRSHDQDILQTE